MSLAQHDTPTPHQAELMPVWFRRALIVVAALVMCSCRAEGQEVYYEEPPCPACETGSCPTGCTPPAVGSRDEYLCDGDDAQSPAAVLNDGSVAGLEQEDTIGYYTTRDGRIITTPSNRVCIYAPRFGAVRQVVMPAGTVKRLFIDQVGDSRSLAEADESLPPVGANQVTSLAERAVDLPPGLFRTRQQPGESVRLEAVAQTVGLVGPYANLQLVHLGIVDLSEGPLVAEASLAAITWTGDLEPKIILEGRGASAVFSSKQAGVIYETEEPNRPKLRVVKLASTDSAHPGEEVEFTLRFDNIGDTPISEVTIVDNLTTRLAYVEGSAKSTVDAEFSYEDNQRGSLVLQWAIAEPLEPGEGGVLTFRTRVR